jgi:hypothetical protein
MDIVDKIIPFFEKYPIIGVKLDNYNDFCKAAQFIKDKEHLTVEGLEKIRLPTAVHPPTGGRLLKSNMNTLSLRDLEILTNINILLHSLVDI